MFMLHLAILILVSLFEIHQCDKPYLPFTSIDLCNNTLNATKSNGGFQSCISPMKHIRKKTLKNDKYILKKLMTFLT